MSDHHGFATDRGDAALATALARAVREVGRALATDPRRVQGMVTDVLGHESRTRRAEIDAVVMAAEESIPEDLLACRIDLDTAVARLAYRGLDTPVARFAVEVWRYALGMLAENAEPPTLTGLEPNTAPGVTDRVSDRSAERDLLAFSPTVLPPLPAPAPNARLHVNGDQRSARAVGAHGPQRSRAWLLIAVPVLVLAVAGGAFLSLDGSGESLGAAASDTDADTAVDTGAGTAEDVTEDTADDTGAEPGDVTREEDAVTPTITEPAPTTAAAATSATIGFTPFTTPHGTVTRTWEITDGNLQATLVVVNDTGDPVTDERYYEAIPKSIADNAAEISSSPSHTVIKDDPVIAWDLTIDSGATVTIRYTIPVTDDVTADTLSTWRADQITAANEFSAERKARPRLEVVTRNGSVIATRDTAIELDVSPDATVVINGFEITPNSKGNWPVTGLAEGTNTLNIIAISPYGVRSRATLELIVQLPTTSTAIGTAISGPELVIVGCSYTYFLGVAGYAPTFIDWSNGEYWDGQDEATYEFTAAGSWSISVTTGVPDGRTETATIYMTAVDGGSC